MLSLTQAESNVGDWRLTDCDLYVTKEPCPLCAGAIVHCRIRLGWGIHGSVWKITGKERSFAWALKLHRHPAPWRRERDCYRRLQEMGTSHIAGVHLPQFIRDDEEWLAIEMSVVKRPFLLDFGAAWLDERPDFPEDVWEQADADAAEKFGEGWPRASSIIYALESETGIIMGDVHPGNLALH